MCIFVFFFFFYLLLLKVTKVTTEHQKEPQQKHQNKPFFGTSAKKKALAEDRSPPQELEVGPHSGPYLPVYMKAGGGENITLNTFI